jgi:hypothetical protein
MHMTKHSWVVLLAVLWGCASKEPAKGTDDGGADGGSGMDAAAPHDGSAAEAGPDATLDGSQGNQDAALADAAVDGSVAFDAGADGDGAPCVTDSWCDDGNSCTCNPRLPDGSCATVNLPTCIVCPGYPPGGGFCLYGVCLPYDCFGLDDECNVGVCDPDPSSTTGCLVEPKPDCTPCAGGEGVCSAGTCVTDECPPACLPDGCPGG